MLDTILQYKQQKEAQANADLQAIPQAAMLYQQAKQQGYENQIKGLLAQATLAKSGMIYDQKKNQLRIDPNLQAGSKPVFTIDDNGNLTQVDTVAKNAVVKQLPQSVDTIGKKAEAQRQATVNNPMVNQDTQGAVSAYQYVQPRIQRLNEMIDSGLLKGDLLKQVTVGKSGDLVVPDGSPLEEMIGLLNEIKLTGFGLGGKNFTENEAKIVFGRLDPTGKSDKRIKSDLAGLQEFFKEKAQAGTRGLSETKAIIGGDVRPETATQTKMIGSTTYEKREDGKWYPKKG